uniref:60S ribosomal protein L34 n=1 Tax=Prorocentrum micans TaxID=2945 RepID=A0A7S2TCS5_PROMC|mmetsp:Transcript_15427/g.19100  ORF Transcript_15427/g.19100 Transcript_15427/m.19100 type:complete len:117 (-) Transcript_15427:1399-1749(-)
MTKNTRITYKRRHSYATKSNKIRAVKTPGGRLTAQYIKKKAAGPKCGDCAVRLPGIPALRPKQYKNLHKREKSVSRAYGGNRCAGCVRERIVRAFLIEEQKVVKRLLAQKAKKSKK